MPKPTESEIRSYAGDGEYAAALHILMSPLFSRDARVWSQVYLGESTHPKWDWRGIFFEDMLAVGTFSSGEQLMLQAAWSLFNGDTDVNLSRLVNVLSDDNLRRVLRAIAI